MWWYEEKKHFWHCGISKRLILPLKINRRIKSLANNKRCEEAVDGFHRVLLCMNNEAREQRTSGPRDGVNEAVTAPAKSEVKKPPHWSGDSPAAGGSRHGAGNLMRSLFSAHTSSYSNIQLTAAQLGWGKPMVTQMWLRHVCQDQLTLQMQSDIQRVGNLSCL